MTNTNATMRPRHYGHAALSSPESALSKSPAPVLTETTPLGTNTDKSKRTTEKDRVSVHMMIASASVVDGYSIFFAGGGFKGGTSYGQTDEFGNSVVENAVDIHDVHATILHQLGLDHETLTYRYGGRDHRLTDVHGRVIQDWLE